MAGVGCLTSSFHRAYELFLVSVHSRKLSIWSIIWVAIFLALVQNDWFRPERQFRGDEVDSILFVHSSWMVVSSPLAAKQRFS